MQASNIVSGRVIDASSVRRRDAPTLLLSSHHHPSILRIRLWTNFTSYLRCQLYVCTFYPYKANRLPTQCMHFLVIDGWFQRLTMIKFDGAVGQATLEEFGRIRVYSIHTVYQMIFTVCCYDVLGGSARVLRQMS